MNSRTKLISCLLLSAAALFAQATLEVRDIDIDSLSPEGAVLTQAGIAETAEERIGILEGFLEDYPRSGYWGYAMLQLQNQYIVAERWEEAAKIGEQLLTYLPEDLEIRSNQSKALVGAQMWPELLQNLTATQTVAAMEATAPAPEGATEDQQDAHQAAVDYANGVLQYTEWALNLGGSQSEPALASKFLDALASSFSEGQHNADVHNMRITAYQQAGNLEGVVMAAERALVYFPDNERYLFTLAESAISLKRYDLVNARAQELIELMEDKPAPEGVSGEEWDAHKKKFTGLAHFAAGMAQFQKGAWRTARRHLLQSVSTIQSEGGERYGILAYMLGFCYVKLDIAGDNIAQATRWMSEAARVPNPMQAQAAQTLKAIQDAQ